MLGSLQPRTWDCMSTVQEVSCLIVLALSLCNRSVHCHETADLQSERVICSRVVHLRGPLASLAKSLVGQESGGAGSTTYW